jgi:hypothetical protein
MPEQKTKISVASENPKRAGIHKVQVLPGACASRMINIAMPRKKSSRGSRGVLAAVGGNGPVVVVMQILLTRSRSHSGAVT